MLSEADLLNLIRLTELELDQIHKDLDSENETIGNEAGEMSIQMDMLAQKLKKMYCNLRSEDSELPTYDEYLSLLERIKANKER